MTIKDRLSLQFTLISTLLLLVVLSGIYILTAQYQKSAFHDRLLDRATTTAELFLAEDNLTKEKFNEVQKKYPQSLPDEIVHIYNDNDVPVFINANANQWPKQVIDKVRQNKSVYYIEGNKQTVGIYYVDNSGNFTVMLSAIDAYGLQQMQQLFWLMVVAFFISFFIMLFTGRLFSKIALLPIIKVINEVKFIRATSLHKRLQIKSSKDEINELAITFNNLLEHLEQSFESQSSFVAHASHELRTPFTSIIGDIEVTLIQNRDAREYKETLQRVLAEAAKLNDLLNDLLQLTQSNIDITSFEDVRLDEVLWQVKDEWMNRVKGSNIELIYDLPADTKKYTLPANDQLLFIAIGNIIKNALKFSNGKTITCKLYLVNSVPTISIKDFGIGISENNIKKIFQPFYRGENTFGYPGFGIGLSLTDKILKLHNASISVTSAIDEGTEFLIHF